jgi:RHS repeat-associated protein
MTHRALPYGNHHHHGHSRPARRSAGAVAGGEPIGESLAGQLFQGAVYDTAAGLHDCRNRTYSPTLAAWVPHDPLGYVDGLNVYTVPSDNPTCAVDPLGE